MESASPAAADDGNLDEQGGQLVQLLAELVRNGWQLKIQAIPNDWGAMAEAEVVFENMRESDTSRTAQEDMQAVAQGLSPQAPVHWKFDPFAPRSIYEAVKRFHHLFVERGQKP